MIKDSAIDLIKHQKGISRENIYTVNFVRNTLSNSQIRHLADTDVAFIAGGPGYKENFFPVTYPSIKKVLDVTTVVCLGPGWKGHKEDGYSFSKKSLKVLTRIANQECVPFLGARDLPSVRVLRNHGLPAKLTGCPAWYCHDGFPPEPKFSPSSTLESITVSTPPRGDARHILQFIILLRTLLSNFPDVQIEIVFHRGEQDLAFKPVMGKPWRRNILKKNFSSILYGIVNIISRHDRVSQQDASGSSRYKNTYFNSDIHVGYRVHAHIPSLSAGTPSFLLQIDGRGLGVSESLGTDGDIFARNGLRYPVYKIVNNIESYIRGKSRPFTEVCGRIEGGYGNMKELIRASTEVRE